MRSPSRLGMLILVLMLMDCRRGAAQVGEPVRQLAEEENLLEASAEPGQPAGGKPKGATPPGRTPMPRPMPAPRASKEKRRPAAGLELPEEMDKETAEGLSLDEAIPRLLAVNRNLAVKYQDIPKARADILSAGLIENPSVFLDSEGIPYGNYSPQRPGETSYGPTVVQPFDVSGKRGKRIQAARCAEKVLEALYQDAVRQEIDKLYSAYVDALESQIERDALRRTATDLSDVVETVRLLAGHGAPPASETAEAAMQRGNTEIALRQAEANLLQTRRDLALLLAIPSEQADNLLVRGSIRDRAPPPPGADDLVQLALRTRPDLAAFQLSVERARVAVQLSRAERFEDVLVFYTPYQAITFPSQGARTATGWEAGGLSAVPIFDRNQGDIARDRADVSQLQIQLQALRNQVSYEVRHAATEYAVSRQRVQKIEKNFLPAARMLRAEKSLRFAEGLESLNAFLSAEQSYRAMRKRYLEALVYHRRAMLHVNTVVGQRILP